MDKRETERPSVSFLNDRNREIQRLYVQDGIKIKHIADMYKLSPSRVASIIVKMNRHYDALEAFKEYEIEALFYPNTRIINSLREENINSLDDLHHLMDRIDNYKYDIPNLGERSLKIIRKVLEENDQIQS